MLEDESAPARTARHLFERAYARQRQGALGDAIRLDAPVDALDLRNGRWHVAPAGITAGAVVVATPAGTTAKLVGPHAPDAGALLADIGYSSVALVALAMGALAFHLHHGIWSMFQSMGISQRRYESFARKFATVFTIVVTVGFALVPLAVLLRWLK